jgi:hypothetical protein
LSLAVPALSQGGGGGGGELAVREEGPQAAAEPPLDQLPARAARLRREAQVPMWGTAPPVL